MRTGFTLVELLVVIGIVIVLSSIGFSLYGKALRGARDSQSVSNLRQISVCMNLDAEDHGGALPLTPNLDPTPLLKYTKSKEVFYAPGDPYPEGANSQAGVVAGFKVSYDFIPETEPVRSELLTSDANPGLVVCLPCRARNSMPLHSRHSDFEGPLLRARLDTSVERKTPNLLCYVDADGAQSRGFHAWAYFTDMAPTPPVMAHWISPGSRLVPCSSNFVRG